MVLVLIIIFLALSYDYFSWSLYFGTEADEIGPKSKISIKGQKSGQSIII